MVLVSREKCSISHENLFNTNAVHGNIPSVEFQDTKSLEFKIYLEINMAHTNQEKTIPKFLEMVFCMKIEVFLIYQNF